MKITKVYITVNGSQSVELPPVSERRERRSESFTNGLGPNPADTSAQVKEEVAVQLKETHSSRRCPAVGTLGWSRISWMGKNFHGYNVVQSSLENVLVRK